MIPIVIASSNKSGISPSAIAQALAKAGATSASRAVRMEFDPTMLDEAIGLGLVLRSRDGKLHVNERAVAERSNSLGMTACVVLLAAASIAASAIALIAFLR